MKKNEKTFFPTKDEREKLANDMRMIDDMYKYRSHEEAEWLKYAQQWNLISEVSKSFNIPISRLITHTGIVMMTQNLPKIGMVPENPDDVAIIQLIQDLNDHYDRLNGMDEVYHQVFVDYAVLGNAVIEDYIQYPYIKRRRKVNGKWQDFWVRDFSRPKVATRARSPWECAFDPGARTVSEVRACTFKDVISYSEFQEIYNTKNSIFKNTEFVEGGRAFFINDEGEEDYRSLAENQKNKVGIQHFQDEREDCYRIYANGIPILDASLSEFHKHGKITLSLLTNHHSYDPDYKRHRLYGKGDMYLVDELHQLLNAMYNQFIRNYEKKNTSVISIEGGIGLEDIDITSGDIIPGKVNVQSLGQADLAEFDAMSKKIEELAIQISQKNYKTLEGEVAKTATEMKLKNQRETMGIRHQIKKIENVGLLAHYQKRVSDMMQYSTEEEIINIADINIEDMSEFKEEYGFEVIKNNGEGNPLAISRRERFMTKGRSFSPGAKSRKDLQVVEEGVDGVLTAYPEFVQTKEFRIYGNIPQIYIVPGSSLAEDKEYQYENLMRAFNLSLQIEQAKMTMPQSTDVSMWNSMKEKAFDLIDIDKDAIVPEDKELAIEEQELDNIVDVLKNPATQPTTGQLGGQAPSFSVGTQQGPSGGPASPVKQDSLTMA